MTPLIDFEDTPTVDLVQFMGGDDMVALSAWVSYAGDQEGRLEDRKRVGGLIDFLMREEHATPFEHSVFTFRISCPIFVAREFFRHRTASYSEQSARYTQLEYKFYVPNPQRPLTQVGKAGAYTFEGGTVEQTDVVEREYERVIVTSVEAYQTMLDAGIAKEVARNVLPVGQFTSFYVTMNARNLMHFLHLRTDPQALYEIRDVAEGMEVVLSENMPFTYAAWVKAGRR